MSAIGWIHTVLASLALLAGAVNLVRPKGTPSHRWGGGVFAAAMVGLNLSALAIYRLTGHFNLFHGLAFASLVTLAVGLFPVIFKRPRRYWLDLHYFAIAWAYLGLLAAFANELVARIPALSAAIVGSGPLTPALIARIFQASGVLAQLINLLGFALLLWRYDTVMAKLGRRSRVDPAPHGCAGASEIMLLFAVLAIVHGATAQFLPVAAGGVGQFLGIAGGVLTLILAIRHRGAPGELRWLAGYYFLVFFAVAWVSLFTHFAPRDAAAFRISVQLFGLVAMGVVVSGELVIAGLAALVALVAAYQWAPDWFALCSALVYAGALLFASWRLRLGPPVLLAQEAS